MLNGVVIGVGGSLASAWLTACGRSLETAALFAQDRPTYYPPALTGMRGSHDGSWELAHALRDGTFWQQAGAVTDTRETYDLVVVGCGISGLAAAYFFRQQVGNDAASCSSTTTTTSAVTRRATSSAPADAAARQRRHALNRDADAVQLAGPRAPDGAGHRSANADGAMPRPAALCRTQAGGVLQQTDVRRGPARGPRSDAALGGVPRPHAAVAPPPSVISSASRKRPSTTCQGLSSDAKKDRLSRLSYQDFC